MAPFMLCRSLVAVAAARTCRGAFVATAPCQSTGLGCGFAVGGPLAASGSTQSALGRHKSHPRVLHVGPSLRAASSSALLAATAKTLLPLVVCGPSGVGKGTIISRFMEGPGAARFGFSVSHTTRRPRPGEVDGVHYHFTSREDMLEKIRSGTFFIEHAEVHGNLYGTSFQSILDVSSAGGSGVDRQCLLDIDVEGVRSIKEFQARQRREGTTGPVLGKERSTQQYSSAEKNSGGLPMLDAKFVFIAPPSVDVLRERLMGRGTETPETLERRFRNAKAELEYGMEEGNFDAIVVNDDLDEACAEFGSIVSEMYC